MKLFSALCLVAMAATTNALKIMPLGDSITGSPGCWRAYLWQSLNNAGLIKSKGIDFVGTLPAQGCGFTYDGENEGHGGYLATNVANQNLLPGWLSSTRPDIVLMHFGTNDVWNNIAPATILNAFTTLLNQMRASNPNMKLFVAQILPMHPSGCSACDSRVQAFNAQIPSWASSHSTSASPIYVVDQYTGFSNSLTSDGVHPTTAGHQVMASKWYNALAPRL